MHIFKPPSLFSITKDFLVSNLGKSPGHRMNIVHYPGVSVLLKDLKVGDNFKLNKIQIYYEKDAKFLAIFSI